jgi:hypothetical protein
VIYTLLGNCRRHSLNPNDYLNDLFTRLPAAKINKSNKFTLAAWAKIKAKEKPIAQGTGDFWLSCKANIDSIFTACRLNRARGPHAFQFCLAVDITCRIC